jgi:hypothetical protein
MAAMSIPSGPPCAWNATTIEWLNARLGVQHDDDVGCEDWPGAMADPTLVDTALDAYDNPDAGQAGRALVVEWLLETFEFCTIEREGNPDWRRTLDRIERDYAEHAATVQRWADPEDGNPWLVSAELQALRARQEARKAAR